MFTASKTGIISRAGWDPGPWDEEPDLAVFEHVGFPCLIVRRELGQLCGYVAVPPGHPAHGLDYHQESDALTAALQKRLGEPMGETPGMGVMLAALSGDVKATPEIVFSVHGGITFARGTKPTRQDIGLDALPDPWWFGFDCAHSGDWCPGHSAMWRRAGHPEWARPSFGDHYRTVEYVVSEIRSLAEQLRAVVAPTPGPTP